MRKGMMIRKPGLYKFEIEQAMRVEELEGITDVGLKIVKQ
jgi:gliding motility-associated lipoprotein GldH